MSFTVLVCDDSAIARKMAIKSLPSALQKNVYQAADGEEALSVLNARRIDLLLLDLTMPVLDGVGVLESIRQHVHEVYVLIISGDIQPHMQQKIRQFNVLGFLPKPVCTTQMSYTLNQYGLY
ncbi:response regulator [Salinimonas sp. HHU 13199]|uniref:Response regulator n=1 Tax=Salinimonas profundi TaxID=2729140 RepID=A0ABR8LLG5_9ALTE|nr:response regulator [Salinimonas profundi]MBD3586153.1 response regulator [Salinimonas profundi]